MSPFRWTNLHFPGIALGLLLLAVNSPGNLNRTQQENRGLISALEWSPNGNYLAVSGSQAIWIYDASLQDVTSLEGTDFLRVIAWSPDGTKLAVAREKAVEIWDSKSWKHIATLEGHEWSATSIAFSPDSQTIATGSYDKTIRLWDAVSGQPIHTLTGHDASVRALQWSDDGQMLLSAAGIDPSSTRLEVARWDIRQFTLISIVKGDASLNDALVPPVPEPPEKKSLARLAVDNIELSVVVLFAALAGFIFLLVYGRRRLRGTAKTLLTVVLGSLSTVIVLVGVLVFLVWCMVGSVAAWVESIPGNDYAAMTFRSDGKILAVGGWYDNKVRLWNVETGAHIATWPVGNISGTSIRTLAWSPDGNWLIASETTNGQNWVLNAKTGTLSHPEEQNGYALDFSWRSDGSAVAAVYSQWYEGVTAFDEGIQVWDAEDWHTTHEVTTGYGVLNEDINPR